MFTRSVMKEIPSMVKERVLHEKFKKCSLFRIRVDIGRRYRDLSEYRAERVGLGVFHDNRSVEELDFFDRLYSNTTEHHEWVDRTTDGSKNGGVKIV
jgi:hypothetical protein